MRAPRQHYGWALGVTFAYIALALVLGWFLPRYQGPLLSWTVAAGNDEVTAFLSSVSSGMMAFTGIVFSLLFIIMQFGSSAYSPHLVTMLAQNKVLAHAQGVFTATFLYSLMALRGVGSAAGKGTSALTLWVAFLWLLGSIYLLVRLVGVFRTLAISDVLDYLGESGNRQIERVYPPFAPDQAAAAATAAEGTGGSSTPVQRVVHSGRPKYLVSLDAHHLVHVAEKAGAVIRVPSVPGDSITAGSVLATIHGASELVPEREVRRGIILDNDRSFEAGPKHSMRLLVDIAIRALSSAVNDPTTAVHSLDQLEALLVRLGNASLDVGRAYDRDHTLRVVWRTPTWEEFLDLAITEIQQYGAGSVQVERRLAALFAQLRQCVLPERRAAVDTLDKQRLATLKTAIPNESLRRTAETRDRQGLGCEWNDAPVGIGG